MVTSASLFSDVLYLASSSSTRQQLLRDAQIDFVAIDQTADEKSIDWNQPLTDLVAAIALLKMKHVVLPEYLEQDGTTIYVVTADTLTESADGKILGKPHNRQDAIEQVKLAALGSSVATGFCVARMKYHNGIWLTEAQVTQAVLSYCRLEIPNHLIDYYLDNSCAMSGCGAIIIDGIGMPFLKEIQGSYSAILGLPLFELRQALESIYTKTKL